MMGGGGGAHSLGDCLLVIEWSTVAAGFRQWVFEIERCGVVTMWSSPKTCHAATAPLLQWVWTSSLCQTALAWAHHGTESYGLGMHSEIWESYIQVTKNEYVTASRKLENTFSYFFVLFERKVQQVEKNNSNRLLEYLSEVAQKFILYCK